MSASADGAGGKDGGRVDGRLRVDAVVFDCDGTIADTESVAEAAWTSMLAERGYEATRDDFATIIGHPFPQNWEHFAARATLGDPDAFRAELRVRFGSLMEDGFRVYPDAVVTMRSLAERGVTRAVASSSSRAHVERVLVRAGVDDLVAAIVAAEDVREHKPHPRPYLDAVGHLGVPTGRAGAVEDTSVGVASARAAGLFTVGVRRRDVPAHLLDEADRVVDEIDVSVFLAVAGDG